MAVGTDARNVERRCSTNVVVPEHESGLPRDTVFLCFHVRSLEPSRFLDPARGAARRTGTLPAARMAEVDRALRLSLGL